MTTRIINPGQNIQNAIDSSYAGDIIQVKTGTYHERLSFPRAGSTNNHITLINYPGDTPIIDGTNVTIPGTDNRAGLIQIQKDWIKVQGFKIINSTRSGIRMEHVNNIIIKDNYVKARQCAILNGYYLQSTHLTIDNNICERVIPGTCIYNEIQEVISMGGIDDSEIKNNKVLQNTCGEGIDVKASSNRVNIFNNLSQNALHGIYLDGWCSYINIYNNVVRNHHDMGIKIGEEAYRPGHPLNHVNIYNNLIYNNSGGYAGILLSPDTWRHCIDVSEIQDINIHHNTIYNTTRGILLGTWGCTVPVCDPPLPYKKRWTRINIYRNIVSNSANFQIAAKNNPPCITEVTVDHNFIQGFRNDGNEVKGTNYIEGNPLFVNPANGDFRLQTNSPAIGYGYTSTITPPINYLTVTNPVSGVNWQRGTTKKITWNTNTTTGVVNILYDKNNISTRITNDAQMPPVTQLYYDWNIPSSLAIGSEYKIVVARQTAPIITGESSNFNIIATSVEDNKGDAIFPILGFGAVIILIVALLINTSKQKQKQIQEQEQVYEEPVYEEYENYDTETGYDI